MSPFKALYGYEASSIHDYFPGATKNASIETSLINHQRIIESLKLAIEEAKARMAKQANKHRLDKEFNVDDMVYLKLQKYRQSSVQHRKNHKLSRRFFGPYKIVQRIGKVAYKLLLPKGSRVHPVFHVSLLKPCFGDTTNYSGDIDAFREQDLHDLKPESIDDVRVGDFGQTEVLIKWRQQPVEDSTWEDLEILKQRFPSFNIEDNVIFQQGQLIHSNPLLTGHMNRGRPAQKRSP
ncbi:uncharacterized protein LOC143611973 [Bidens hawaiensis]|uniref:uncharacterized protein LOC143611973 n=1 Tax=Bidens hawaiensis TaxID=980011 RepID=UPI00404A49FF